MFFILNKQKIYTYLVSVVTVVLLFCAASTMNPKQNTIQTSTSSNEIVTVKDLKINENAIIVRINSDWNDAKIDLVLRALSGNDVKKIFLADEEWMKRCPESVKKIKEVGYEIKN